MHTRSGIGSVSISSISSSLIANPDTSEYRSVDDWALEDATRRPLMAADVAIRVDEEAPTTTTTGTGGDEHSVVIDRLNTRVRAAELVYAATQARRHAVYVRLVDLVIHVGVLLWEQMTFRGSWSRSYCDYDMKIWATVWLGASTAKSLLHLGLAWYQLSTAQSGAGESAFLNLLFKQPLLDLFCLSWFIYGIFPVFVWKHQDEAGCSLNAFHARDWALTGWILQAVTYFLPCLLILVCVPCLLCALRVGWVRRRLLPLIFGSMMEPSTNQQPLPEAVLNKLKVVTYGQAISEDLIDPGAILASGGSVNPMNDANSSHAASNDALSQSLISAALPSSLSQAVMNSLFRANSNMEEGRRQATSSENVGTEQDVTASQPASANYPQVPSGSSALPAGPPCALTCPICYVEYNVEDPILLLPCDSRRHVFHESCIKEWLRKSQNCPMCRMNIVEMVNLREQAS